MEVVLRVNQLDACELDVNLVDILQHQLLGALRPLQSSQFLKYLPELKTLLRLLVWRFSLYDHNNTLGQELLDLKYSSSNGQETHLSLFQRGGLFVATVLAEWMLDRADTLTACCPRSLHAQQVLAWMTAVMRTLSLFNFILFLIGGQYPTLKERLFCLGMLPKRPQALREVNHKYLTREILWHGFSEFIFFILPHFNFFSLHNIVRRTSGSKSTNSNCCTLCKALPILPHLSDCGHIYCYYCLKSNLIADSNFPCPACNDVATACIPISEVL